MLSQEVPTGRAVVLQVVRVLLEVVVLRQQQNQHIHHLEVVQVLVRLEVATGLLRVLQVVLEAATDHRVQAVDQVAQAVAVDLLVQVPDPQVDVNK